MGVIFLGGWMFEVVGDYVSGLNYVLLIVCLVWFLLGLLVMDFLKCMMILKFSL